jgi:hypothetical protein
MRWNEKRLLREYIRRSLREEFGDYGGVTPWTSGYGGSTKGSKASSYSSGTSLYSIFIQPFVDATKVIGAELGQVGVRLVSLLATVVETALDALVPRFRADYDKIQKAQQKYISKIKEKYKSSYEAVDDAWDHPDIQFFAFMHDPTTWLSYKAITAKPEAALSVYEALAEGSNNLTLYLRDIRNRLFGASAPGMGIMASGGPQPIPVHAESKLLEGSVAKKIDFQGLEISVDRPEGFVQTGKNSDGDEWTRTYKFDYGFIKGTSGGDGEDLDVFVGPDEDAPDAFIVTQNKEDGSFDEYKAFVGFSSEDDVLRAYEMHIPTEYFDSISTVPVGALKGLLGIEPLEEAAPQKKKTSAEKLADVLTSPQFRSVVSKLPLVQQMKKDADELENRSNAQLKAVMEPVLTATSAQQLSSLSGWNLPSEYSKLSTEEKETFDDVIVSQVKASMATYYQARLNELLGQLLEIGIDEKSAQIVSLRRMITSLEPLKNTVSHGGKIDGKASERDSGTDSTGRAAGTGKSGGGIRQSDAKGGSRDRSAQGGPKGTPGRVQGKAGREDVELGSEDNED